VNLLLLKFQNLCRYVKDIQIRVQQHTNNLDSATIYLQIKLGDTIDGGGGNVPTGHYLDLNRRA
jgi:hypothetical protein